MLAFASSPPLLLQLLVVLQVILELSKAEVGESPPDEDANSSYAQDSANDLERSCVYIHSSPYDKVKVLGVDALIIISNWFRVVFDGFEVLLVTLGCDLDENSMIANLFLSERLAFEAGRDNIVVSDDDVVLIGTYEVVFSEDELVEQVVLVDSGFAISNENFEDVPADESHKIGCGGNLSDRDLLSRHHLLRDDRPVLYPVFVKLLAVQIELVPVFIIVNQYTLLVLNC